MISIDVYIFFMFRKAEITDSYCKAIIKRIFDLNVFRMYFVIDKKWIFEILIRQANSSIL